MELYKKYRPRRWRDIIGQDKVVNSLRSAVAHNKVPTAYAFFGERGCGKTSAAFVLSKAINCPNVSDGDPCNKCDVCLNIDNHVQVGVNYISMANKGGVTDVRDIVQQARLSSPIKRQVWILDEVHTLSQQAFDALLIPLEDPKMPSLFILCSTEPQKIPQTILSRVQSRKFSLVPSDTMTAYLRKLVKHEGLEISEETLEAAVRSGRGSVRDTLTALETVVDTGENGGTYGLGILEALGERNLPRVLSLIAEASKEGDLQAKLMAEQLFEDLRDILVALGGGGKELYPNLPLEDPKALGTQLLGVRGVSILLDEVGGAITSMTVGADPRLLLEISLVKGIQKLNMLKNRLEKA